MVDARSQLAQISAELERAAAVCTPAIRNLCGLCGTMECSQPFTQSDEDEGGAPHAGAPNSLILAGLIDAVVAANEKHGYSHIVTAGTKFGANYLGRAGAQLGVSPISDVVEVLSEGVYIYYFYTRRYTIMCRYYIICVTLLQHL